MSPKIIRIKFNVRLGSPSSSNLLVIRASGPSYNLYLVDKVFKDTLHGETGVLLTQNPRHGKSFLSCHPRFPEGPSGVPEVKVFQNRATASLLEKFSRLSQGPWKQQESFLTRRRCFFNCNLGRKVFVTR